MLQQTLSRLSSSIDRLEHTQKQEQVLRKGDNVLRQAKAQYGDNSYAIDKVYERRMAQMRDQDLQGVNDRLMRAEADNIRMNSQLEQNAVMLAQYREQNEAAKTEEQARARLQEAQAFQGHFGQAIAGMANTGAYGQYMNVSREGLGSLLGNLMPGGQYGNSGEQLSFQMEQALADKELRAIQSGIMDGDMDIDRINSYHAYQKEKFEKTQQASMNFSVSRMMGMDGTIDKGEFEQGYLPALTGMAEGLNTDLASAIDAIKKLKEVGAVAADFRGGTAVDISNAVDQSMVIMGKLAKLTGAQTSQELVRAASGVAQYGNGDFNWGMKNIMSETQGVYQSGQDRFNEVMSVSNDPYMHLFGTNRGGIEMSLFHNRSQDFMSQWGDRTNTTNAMLGGAGGISDLVSKMVAQNITDPMLNASVRGGGSMMAGVADMSQEIANDPMKFLLNRNTESWENRNAFSGEAGYQYAVGTKFDDMKKMMPHMSDDEIFLLLAKGDTTQVNALKQFKLAKNAELDDFQGFLKGMAETDRSLSSKTRDTSKMLGEDEAINYDTYLEDLDAAGSSRVWSNVKDVYRGRGRSIDNLGTYGSNTMANLSQGMKKSWDKFTDMKGEYRGTLDRLDSMERESMSFAKYQDENFIPSSNTQYELNVDFSNSKLKMDEKSSEDLDIALAMVEGLATANGEDIVQDAYEDADDAGGIVTIPNVKKTLLKVLYEGSLHSANRDSVRKAIEYVKGASVTDIKNKLVLGGLSKDHPFYVLVQRSRGLAAGDSTTTNLNQTFTNMRLDNLMQQGLSKEEAMERIGQGKGMRDLHTIARKTEDVASAIGSAQIAISGALVVGGAAMTATVAGAPIGIPMMGAGKAVFAAGTAATFVAEMVGSFADTIIADPIEWSMTTFGESHVDTEVFNEYLADETYSLGTSWGKEIETLLRYIYGIMEKGSWGDFFNEGGVARTRNIMITAARATAMLVEKAKKKKIKVIPEGDVKEVADSIAPKFKGLLGDKGDLADELALYLVAAMSNPRSQINKQMRQTKGSSETLLIREIKRMAGQIDFRDDYKSTLQNEMQNILAGEDDSIFIAAKLVGNISDVSKSIQDGKARDEMLGRMEEKISEKLSEKGDSALSIVDGTDNFMGMIKSIMAHDADSEGNIEELTSKLGNEDVQASLTAMLGRNGKTQLASILKNTKDDKRGLRAAHLLSKAGEFKQTSEANLENAEAQKWAVIFRETLNIMARDPGEVKDQLRELGFRA